MSQDTTLTFTDEELEAIHNQRFFEVKNSVTTKIFQLFGELEKELINKVTKLPFFLDNSIELKETGKIFKGENYRLMPYTILDCPRIFTTDNIFAFRSMFLWGNEFSFTLHLQGKSLERFKENINKNISNLLQNDFFICINDTPWEYSFDKKNYISLDELNNSTTQQLNHPNQLNHLIQHNSFLKFSRRLELKEYNSLVTYGMDTFEMLMNIIR